ncbi:MAG: hypothetical protein HYX79_00105 [Chloroflexi bacterium]|nr:hypothetical protein [Chloroflexota bacterium]
MNDIQDKIAELQLKGWTLAAIAGELGVTVNAVEKWKAGDRYPTNTKAVLMLLDRIKERKRIPKRKRYTRGGHSEL